MFGVEAGERPILTIIFGMIGPRRLLTEAPLAFIRHALSKYYRDACLIASKGIKAHWTLTFRDALVSFRDAALRYAHGMARLYANRKHTNLTAQVPEEDRERFAELIEINPLGKGKLTSAFQNAISRAESVASNRGQ